MAGSPRTWAEIVRRSKRKAKKASGSAATRQSGGKAVKTPKAKPFTPTLTDSEDAFDPVQLPKMRSLKKRSDKAIASAAKFSITKRSGSSMGRGSSQKKRQKVKSKMGCNKKQGMKNEEDDRDSGLNDDSISASSTTTTTDNLGHPQAYSMSMADFLNFPIKKKPLVQQPCTSPMRSLRWPTVPKISLDTLLKANNPLWRCQSNYESLISLVPSSQPKVKLARTFRGLVDLDVVDPCTPLNPCLLDRLSMADQVCMACFHN